MKSIVVPFVLGLALLLVCGDVAFAEDPPAEGAAPVEAAPVPETAPAGPMRWVPARRERRCREVVIPAVTRERCVPEFEEVDVPLYQMRCVPQYREIEVPTWQTREVPCTATRCVPVYEDVEVPCYETREVPVTREVCDHCTGEPRTVACGCRTETVQVGTRTERRQTGWRREEVQVGMRLEYVQAGTEKRRVQCGVTWERVEAGTCKQRVFKGYRRETVVVCPERTQTVEECVCVPGRWEPCEGAPR